MKRLFCACASIWAVALGAHSAPVSSYPNATTPLQGTETALGTQLGDTVSIPVSQISAYTRSQLTGSDVSSALGYTPAHAGANTDITSLASPTITTSLGLSTAPASLHYGNQTGAVGGAMVQDWVWTDGVTDPKTIGGIWPGTETYAAQVFSSTFTNSKPGSQSLNGGPSIQVMELAWQNGALNSIVANEPVCTTFVAASLAGYCEGTNVISRAVGTGAYSLPAQENDVEFPAGSSDAGGSFGLGLNIFNVASVSPAFQLGGIGGGTWANGGVFTAVTGSDLVDLSGDVSQSFINTSNRAAFGSTAIILGTGIGQGIAWGGASGGTNPFVYGDSGGNVVTQLGAGNAIIKDRSGRNNLFTVVETSATTATVTVNSISTPPVAISALPASPVAGQRAAVNNAAACVFNTGFTGTGALFCPVIYTGADWVGG